MKKGGTKLDAVLATVFVEVRTVPMCVTKTFFSRDGRYRRSVRETESGITKRSIMMAGNVKRKHRALNNKESSMIQKSFCFAVRT